jgi:hypothetical protein
MAVPWLCLAGGQWKKIPTHATRRRSCPERTDKIHLLTRFNGPHVRSAVRPPMGSIVYTFRLQHAPTCIAIIFYYLNIVVAFFRSVKTVQIKMQHLKKPVQQKSRYATNHHSQCKHAGPSKI